MQNNIIKVGAFDELASIMDEISEKNSDTIFLQVSDDAYIAQNVLNFMLIKREADGASKNVVIVSSNARIRGLASRASLQTRTSLPPSIEKNNFSKNFNAPSGFKMVTDIVAPKDLKEGQYLAHDKIKVQDIRPTQLTPEHIFIRKEKDQKKDNFLQNLRAKVGPVAKNLNEQNDTSIVKKINTYSDNKQNEESFYQKSPKKSRILIQLFGSIKRNFRRFLIIFSTS